MGTGDQSAPHARPRTAEADRGGEQGQGHGHGGKGYRDRPEMKPRAPRGREWGLPGPALTFGKIVPRLLESVPGGLRTPLRLRRRHKGEGG